MKKIKVLFFIYKMGGGGAARTLLNIINNLDRSKFSPILVTLNIEGSYENELKDDVIFYKLPTNRLSRSILSLSSIIRREKADIIFSTIPRVNTIAIFAKLFSFTKVKSVIREADNLGGSFKVNLQLIGFGLIYKLSNQIVSLSEGVKNNLVQRYKIRPNAVKVIYNPIDIVNINRKMHEAIDEEHKDIFDTNEKIIITAGRLVEQKDQKTLIKSFANINAEIPSRLVILGEGHLKKDLIILAKHLNVRDRVHFIGFQSNPYAYFSRADLFVLTSIHEGFSHVIAEALATGLPVVSTNCKSGPEEVLEKGKYGRLCEVGNVNEVTKQMKDILTLDPNSIDEVVKQGYKRANQFHASKIVKQYENVFLQVIK